MLYSIMDNGERPDAGETRFKVELLFLTIAMMVAASFGLWFTAQWTKDKIIDDLKKEARQHLEIYNTYLTNKIDGYSVYPLILSENFPIKDLCANPSNSGVVNTYLSHFNNAIGASATYVLNKDGIAIASSNWNSPESFVGKNYSFRPYFRRAVKGVSDKYVAIGVTSKAPGYYVSSPVKKDNVVTGVVVVKYNLDLLTPKTKEVMGKLLITDGNDVIFTSNDEAFQFYTMRKLPEGVLSEIRENKQYEGSALQPLPIKSELHHGDATLITLNPSALTSGREAKYVVERLKLQENGWNVYLLSEVAELDKKIFVNMAIASSIIAMMFIVVLLLINLRLRKMKKKLIEHRVELEHKVNERTQELNDINEKLLVELVERRRLENALKIKTDELEHINEKLMELVQKEVSEHSKKEQLLIQQSRMAAMGEMIGVIAHQWRQPLNAISLIVQDLDDAFIHGEMNREYLKTTIQSTMQYVGFMSQTIDDFKNFLKPSKVKLKFDVKEAVLEIVSMFDGIFKKDSVVMSMENSEGTYLTTGYPNEFKQVILNIINNSRDAIVSRRKAGLLERSSPGGIKIGLGKMEDAESAEGVKIIITIVDNGGGIPEDIINRIFDPYFTTKPEDKGTGIGLYMSKTIIENNMGGRLTVQNTDDGAEFTIAI
ncbi:MAG: hypothetical protein HQL01_01980 [Nitrospirae bacterium]|nr:hypothetical protein [Nitrospirota bacterium]